MKFDLMSSFFKLMVILFIATLLFGCSGGGDDSGDVYSEDSTEKVRATAQFTGLNNWTEICESMYDWHITYTATCESGGRTIERDSNSLSSQYISWVNTNTWQADFGDIALASDRAVQFKITQHILYSAISVAPINEDTWVSEPFYIPEGQTVLSVNLEPQFDKKEYAIKGHIYNGSTDTVDAQINLSGFAYDESYCPIINRDTQHWYIFNRLKPGIYTLVPSFTSGGSGLAFSPASRTFTVTNSNVLDLDFSITEEQDSLFKNSVSAVITNNAYYPYIATHTDGSKMIILSDGNTMTGVTFLTPSGDEAVLYMESDFLPSMMVFNDYIFVFKNYTSDTVDIAMIKPNGDIVISRGVSVDPDAITELQNGFPVSSSSTVLYKALSQDKFIRSLQLGGIAIGTFGCAAAYIAGGPAGIPCTLALIGITKALLPEDEPALVASSVFLGTVACGAGDVTSCVGLLVDTTADVLSAAETTTNQQQDKINLASSALDTGYGDVKVTLTWDTPTDQDLYVTDPNGDEIYYGNPTSPSGGQLDEDDRDGYGPENIFWPTGQAPNGTYTVEVDYFSGAGITNIEVLTEVDGQLNTYSRTINPGEKIEITTFTR